MQQLVKYHVSTMNNMNKSMLMILTVSIKMDLIDALKLIWLFENQIDTYFSRCTNLTHFI